MKIIIAQADIEEAISNFVLGRMTINENMELAIDLSATRGPEGMTATIEVIAKKDELVMPARAARTGAKPGPKPKAQTETVEQQVVAQNEPEIAQAVEEAPNEDNTSIAEQAEAAPTNEAPKSSIFGNLQRPSNTPA